MKISLGEDGLIELEEVFNGVMLKSKSGETMKICMRDSGFEFEYQGELYFAKGGVVECIRGSHLVELLHDSVADCLPQCNNNI